MADGQLIIEISGDSTEFEEDLLTIDAKTKDVKNEIKQVDIISRDTLSKISQSISLINSALTITALVTNQEIDRRFLAIISSMISLQQSVMVFASAQASMGNWAYIPFASAILAQIAMVITTVNQMEQTNIDKAEERDQLFMDGLDL